MAAAPRLPRVLLFCGGALLLLAGVAAVIVGIAIPGRLLEALPTVVVDAAAIGGAAVALGVTLAVAGVVQVLLGFLLGRSGWRAAGVVLLGLVAAVLVTLAAALLTEVAAGSAGWLVAPAGGLLAVAALYGVAVWRLAGARPAGPREPGDPR